MNTVWFQRLGRYALGLLGAGIVACGGGGGVVAPDAGSGAEATRLVALDPPGDSIGLPFGGMVTLRVRYEREDGRPIVGEQVSFSVVVGADEDSGGATLSTTTAVTNGAGIATTDLAAGSQRVMFRISANAPNAPPAFFYVGVSADGFASLIVTPRHQGFRDSSTYVRVELRMYRSTLLRCSDLDIDNLPDSTFPPRSAERFDEPLSYANVTVGTGYTLVAWGVGSLTETALAVGCTDLSTAYLPPTLVELHQLVIDRSPVLSHTTLKTQLDLSLAFEAEARTRAWKVLGCPLGVGQLIFDCLADTLGADGTLDCVSTVVPSPLDLAVRGPVDSAGCRPALAGSLRTIDDELTAAVLASPSVDASVLDDLVDGRKLLTANFVLFSELARSGDSSAVDHVLRRVEFELGGASHGIDLPSVARPLLAALAVPVGIVGNWATVGEHGFTLRPGEILQEGLEVLVLAPSGLGGTAQGLGSTLINKAIDAQSTTSACAAISAVACRHVGAPVGCAAAACLTAATALDTYLGAAFRGVSTAGIDLQLSGAGPFYDGDGDLVVDRFGSDKPGATPGVWSVTIAVEDGDDVAVPATFRTP